MNSSGVPRVLRWLPRASLIKHAFEALCVNEFRGLEFEASEPKAAGDARRGEQVVMLSSRQNFTIMPVRYSGSLRSIGNLPVIESHRIAM